MRSGKYYKKVRTTDGREMDEHRYKMELHVGRRLTRFEVVHHKDGDINNNDISNLQLMTLGEHTILHVSNKRFGAKLIEEQVLAIKRKFLRGKAITDLGREYNVHYSTISLIINLKSFADVDKNGLNKKIMKNKRPQQLRKYKKAS